MVHWPKSIVGKVAAIAIALIAGLALIQSAIALSGSFVWISLAVAAMVVFVAVVVHRRAQAASDLALADAPSFADVLPQWNSRRDLEATPGAARRALGFDPALVRREGRRRGSGRRRSGVARVRRRTRLRTAGR